MTTEITLPFWPSCHQCLQWSEDNLIAVAGGGTLGILVPRLDMLSKEAIRWDTVIVKADGFTQTDIPLLSALSRKNWSIGEELTQRTIVALRWSPPGLGIFSSCVFGVLYSDHNLVLWEVNGRPGVNGDWRKCLVVNHTLQEHYSLHEGQASAGTVPRERIQVSQRIRAFAWYPQSLRSSHEARLYDSGIDPATYHLLAVATEADELLILCIRSPYNILSNTSQQWQGAVLHRITYADVLPAMKHKSPFQSGRSSAITEITWSRCDTQDTSILAFLVSGCIYHTLISVDSSKMTTTEHQVDVQSSPVKSALPDFTKLLGPLQFVPRTADLVCFTADLALAVDLTPGREGKRKAVRQQSINTNWSQISGLGFTEDAINNVSMHLCTHSSLQLFNDTAFSLTRSGFEPAETPLWQQAIMQSVVKFGTAHQLADKILLRTHGLVSMPGGHRVATCISMLPGDSIAHIISSDQSCLVLICDTTERRKGVVPADTEQISASSSMLLNAHQKFYGSKTISLETEQEAAISKHFDRLAKAHHLKTVSIALSSSNAAIIAYLRDQLYRSPGMLANMTGLLTQRLLGESAKSSLSRGGYQSLAAAIAEASIARPGGGPLSRAIQSCYHSFRQALNDISSEETNSESSEWRQRCGICQQELRFEAVRWARCEAGHRFTRCALTLVAIPEPGLSKSCMVCDTQYLNSVKMTELCSLLARKPEQTSRPTAADDDDIIMEEAAAEEEPTGSFARLLLTACERCIMCGGKFASV